MNITEVRTLKTACEKRIAGFIQTELSQLAEQTGIVPQDLHIRVNTVMRPDGSGICKLDRIVVDNARIEMRV